MGKKKSCGIRETKTLVLLLVLLTPELGKDVAAGIFLKIEPFLQNMVLLTESHAACTCNYSLPNSLS